MSNETFAAINGLLFLSCNELLGHLLFSEQNIVADMRKVLAKNPQVEQQRFHRRIFLDNIDLESQALLIMVSCFVKTSRFEEYMCVKEVILLDLLRVISHHRAQLATPIRTVQKIYNEPDVESTFADTISTRSTASTNRSFLLIETNKINGDDKTKASTLSDSKIDFKDVSTSNLDNAQTDDKVTLASSSDSDSNGKASATSTSKTETPYADAPIGSSGDILPGEGSSLKLSAVSQGSGSEKTHISPATSPTKQDGERPVCVLEDNIVLRVALVGSKRTLLIEEDMVHSPIIEPKELAAWRNGNGSTTLGKEKNDDQIPVVPGAVPSDQREKER